MKKILSVILSVALIISAIAVTGIVGASAASADNSPQSLVGRKFTGFDAENWTAYSADSVSDGKLNSVDGKSTNTAQTVGNYTLGNCFDMSFNVQFTNSYNNYYGEYVSVSVGPLEFRISNVSGSAAYTAALIANGSSVAAADLGSTPNGAYTVSYSNGKVSAALDGSTLEWTVGDQTGLSSADISDIVLTNQKIKAVVQNNYCPAGNRYIADLAIYGGANGDFDGDSTVSSFDALVSRQALLGLHGDGAEICDVNHDGSVDSSDYLSVKQHILGLSLLSGYEKNPVNIMCVGDSITAGTGSLGAWRYGLFEMLYGYGASFRLVGKNTTVADFRLPDGYCGYSATGGYTTQNIVDNLTDYLNRDFDVFAIQIGYNDYGHGVETEQSLANYHTILDEVYAKNPNALVYVSTMCPCASYVGNLDWLNQGINPYLPDLVNEYAAKGYSIKYVDNNTGMGWVASDFPATDVVHPNDNGLRRIATAFYNAMKDDVKALDLGISFSYDPSVHVEGINVDANSVSIEVGAAKSVNATVSPSNATVHTVLWASDDESIATVTDNGRIAGKAVGSTTVTATSLDGKFVQNITVTVTPSTEAEGTALFSESFTNLDNWTASEGSDFSTSWIKACIANLSSPEGTLTTNNTYAYNNGFKLEFKYGVSTNEKSYGDDFYGSLSYAGFEIRAIDVNRKLALYYNGTLLGIYSSVATVTPVQFTLTYKDGIASAAIDGEVVVSAAVAAESNESEIVYTHKQKWRKCVLSDLKLSTY